MGHVVAGLVACLLLPAYSYARGEGGLAWRMFSTSDSFRLRLLATDRTGHVHLLNPVELSSGVEPALRAYLQGAERFRSWPVGSAFQARLPALARLGCATGRYASVELTLERSPNLDAPLQVTRARVSCP